MDFDKLIREKPRYSKRTPEPSLMQLAQRKPKRDPDGGIDLYELLKDFHHDCPPSRRGGPVEDTSRAINVEETDADIV